MFASQCMFMCLCFFVVGSYSHDNLVPFIDKCEWSDQSCLLASTKKALPFFAKGLPELGVEPMDPLEMDKVTLHEGELNVDFTDMKVTGTSKCNVLKVVRDIHKNLLHIEAECPIDVLGHYDASGKLLFQLIQGNGPFHVNCKKVYISADVELTTVTGKDGVKYWKISKATHTYEGREKATFHFENLFNGDKNKAEPILTIFNESWKDIMQSVAKPIVDKIVDKILNSVQVFCTKVPADQLEK